MRFHVDVQIHSKYSRATARNADLEHLALWGLKKGITIVGTGDFTHPAWFAQIKETLVPAEPGLYRLRPDIEREAERQAPAACVGRPVRFMLEFWRLNTSDPRYVGLTFAQWASIAAFVGAAYVAWLLKQKGKRAYLADELGGRPGGRKATLDAIAREEKKKAAEAAADGDDAPKSGKRNKRNK